MKCPVDGETLVKTERMGIEIDYCPVCRGVWLDRGELDKIIQRTMDDERFHQGGHHSAPPPPGARKSGRYQEPAYNHYDRNADRHHGRHQDRHHDPYGGYHKPHKGKYYKPRYKKRKSLLGELFEEIFD